MAIRSNLLSAAVVDDDLSLEKTACKLASDLESEFVALGWPTGALFGSEESICEKYGVGFKVYREAIRILTLRGTACLRRSTKSGLVIASPNLEIIIDTLCAYCFLVNVEEEHREQALKIIERLRENIPTQNESASAHIAVDFFLDFLRNQLRPGMPPKRVAEDQFKKTRAGQITLRILDQYFWNGFEASQRIGSEQQISAEFCADRSITRQAIRILESSGLINSIPGRGKGLFTKRPSTGSLCRLLCCHFADKGLSLTSAYNLFELFNLEMTTILAETLDFKELSNLSRIIDDWQSDEPLTLEKMIGFEDSLFSNLNNPLLVLIFRSMRGFIAPTIATDNYQVSTEIADYYAEYAKQLLEAIKKSDSTTITKVQKEKMARMRELKHKYYPKMAEQLYS